MQESLLAEQRQRLAKGKQVGAAETHCSLASTGQQSQAFLQMGGQKTKLADCWERK